MASLLPLKNRYQNRISKTKWHVTMPQNCSKKRGEDMAMTDEAYLKFSDVTPNASDLRDFNSEIASEI